MSVAQSACTNVSVLLMLYLHHWLVTHTFQCKFPLHAWWRCSVPAVGTLRSLRRGFHEFRWRRWRWVIFAVVNIFWLEWSVFTVTTVLHFVCLSRPFILQELELLVTEYIRAICGSYRRSESSHVVVYLVVFSINNSVYCLDVHVSCMIKEVIAVGRKMLFL